MSKRKKKRFYQRPVAMTFLIVSVIVVALFGSYVGRLIALSGDGTLEPAAADGGIFAPNAGKIGDTLDFFTWIRNGTPDPLILQSAVVEIGSPDQVSLLDVSVATMLDGSCCDYDSDTQWPPVVYQGHNFILQPVSGFILAPYADAAIIFAVRAHATGTFLTGPVTVDALKPAFPGAEAMGLGLKVSHTYYTYGILCYAGQVECNQQVQSVQESMGL